MLSNTIQEIMLPDIDYLIVWALQETSVLCAKYPFKQIFRWKVVNIYSNFLKLSSHCAKFEQCRSRCHVVWHNRIWWCFDISSLALNCFRICPLVIPDFVNSFPRNTWLRYLSICLKSTFQLVIQQFLELFNSFYD